MLTEWLDPEMQRNRYYYSVTDDSMSVIDIKSGDVVEVEITGNIEDPDIVLLMLPDNSLVLRRNGDANNTFYVIGKITQRFIFK